MAGTAISSEIINLEAVINDACASSVHVSQEAGQCIAALKEEVINHVTAQLAHTLCMVSGHFNELSIKR